MSKIFIFILLITLLGGFLRLYDNTKNPPSLNIDEVSFGYSAYSILKTGRDEYGVFMPLTFKSTGDYKNPMPVYLMVPSIALFGLNEFAVRFPNFLLGTLTIPLFFFFLKFISKDIVMATIGAFLLAISPWHIHYSRYNYESVPAILFIIFGIWFFLKMLNGSKIYGVLSAVFFLLSMYTAWPAKIFVPLFILTLLLLSFKKRKFKKIKTSKSTILLFLTICLILVLPLLYVSLFRGAATRIGMTFLSKDIDYTRYAILDHIHKLDEPFILLFFWLKRYLNYFQPDFLFFNGLNMTYPGTLGLGILNLFELPWLILGLIEIFRKHIPYKWVILSWIMIGILPASLTNNEHSEGRTLIVLPALLFIITLGLVKFIGFIKSLEDIPLKVLISILYSVFIIFSLIYAFLIFSVHFPIELDEAFMGGTKQTVEYALKNKDKYDEIVFDPRRGIQGPYIVSIPHMYILFYSKYNPDKYQKEAKKIGNDSFKFDKFTIRNIKWVEDKYKKNTLFIGSPWSFIEKDLKEGEVLERIYLKSGNLAFLIVSPK